MSNRILIVDDEAPVRRVLRGLLSTRGHDCVEASDAGEARARLDAGPFQVVLSDVNMPGESGIELVRHVVRTRPDTAAVMITGVDDPALAELALEIGAYGYIVKPFKASEVLIGVSNALRRRALEVENRAHRDRLEDLVRERTGALRTALDQLEARGRLLRGLQEETVRRLAAAAEFRDAETGRHIDRMSRLCELLARRAGLDGERCDLILAASPLHDVGKIAIPDAILRKPGRLTPEEYDVMKGHAEIGHRLLSGSEFQILRTAADIAWTHHERIDGRGYPRGLRGDAIPLEGRIAAVADVVDAITSRRVYKPAYPLERAVAQIRDGRGSQFDPGLVDVLLGSLDDARAVLLTHADP